MLNNHAELLTEDERDALLEGIQDARQPHVDRLNNDHIVVRGLLVETELTLRDLLALNAGDVIPIDMPEQALLNAEGIGLYSGNPGQLQGYRTIRIHRPLTVSEILQNKDFTP